MTRLIRTALVAALGLLTVGGATADDAEDVVAAAQGVLKAYNSGDAKKASSFFTDDADYYSGNGRGLTDFDSDRHLHLSNTLCSLLQQGAADSNAARIPAAPLAFGAVSLEV